MNDNFAAALEGLTNYFGGYLGDKIAKEEAAKQAVAAQAQAAAQRALTLPKRTTYTNGDGSVTSVEDGYDESGERYSTSTSGPAPAPKPISLQAPIMVKHNDGDEEVSTLWKHQPDGTWLPGNVYRSVVRRQAQAQNRPPAPTKMSIAGKDYIQAWDENTQSYVRTLVGATPVTQAAGKDEDPLFSGPGTQAATTTTNTPPPATETPAQIALRIRGGG